MTPSSETTPLAGTHAWLSNGLDAPEVAKRAMMSRSITSTVAITTLAIAMFCFVLAAN
jgi:hypothetical protein